jgi:hypothetical protein
MAAHPSDCGFPSNIRRRMSKWHTMVMKFVGGVVSVVDRILMLFLSYISYGAGVFIFSLLGKNSLHLDMQCIVYPVKY